MQRSWRVVAPDEEVTISTPVTQTRSSPSPPQPNVCILLSIAIGLKEGSAVTTYLTGVGLVSSYVPVTVTAMIRTSIARPNMTDGGGGGAPQPARGAVGSPRRRTCRSIASSSSPVNGSAYVDLLFR